METTITLTIAPRYVTIQPSGRVTFSAIVQGTSDQTVDWAIAENANGSTAGGTITSSGVYTAPPTTGSWHVTATSRTWGVSSTANVDVIQMAAVPGNDIVEPGETRQFGVSVTGGSTSTPRTAHWALLGSGSDRGFVTWDGYYTAGQSFGNVLLQATSDADPSLTVTATATIALASLRVDPGNATVVPGTRLSFRAMSRSGQQQSVSWTLTNSQGMPYSGSSPGGTSLSGGGVLTTNSSLSSAETVGVKATSTQDSSKTDIAFITVRPPSQTALTGTVNYAGPAGGRVFIAAVSQLSGGAQVGSTSLSDPAVESGSYTGRFSIQGASLGTMSSSSTVTFRAWIDTLGVGQFVAAADPSGTVSVPVSTLTSTGVIPTITLSEPFGAVFGGGPQQQPTPSRPKVLTDRSGAVIRCGPLVDGNGRELVDHYIGRATPVAGSNSSSSIVTATTRAGLTNWIAFSKLAPGSYTFACSSTKKDTSGLLVYYPWSPESDIVTLQPIRGEQRVSGDVLLPGVTFSTARDARYVHVFATPFGGEPSLVFGAGVPLPSGSHELGKAYFQFMDDVDPVLKLRAIIDRDGDGEFGPTDPISAGWLIDVPSVGVPSTGSQILVDNQPVAAFAVTSHTVSGSSDVYSTSVVAGSNLNLVTRAQLVGGPGMSSPRDMTWGLPERPGFQWLVSSGASAPTPWDATHGTGDLYTILAEFAGDDPAESPVHTTIAVPISGIVTDFPTNVAVTQTITGTTGGTTTPLIQWTPPAHPPAGAFSYGVILTRASGAPITEAWMPSSQVSYTAPALTAGHYQFLLVVQDQFLNRSQKTLSFDVVDH